MGPEVVHHELTVIRGPVNGRAGCTAVWRAAPPDPVEDAGAGGLGVLPAENDKPPVDRRAQPQRRVDAPEEPDHHVGTRLRPADGARRRHQRQRVDREDRRRGAEERDAPPRASGRRPPLGRLGALAELSREKEHERRDHQDERRVRRHHDPKDARIVNARVEERSLDDDERGKPTADDQQHCQRSAREPDEPGDDDPLDDPGAPEVLLDPEQIVVQVPPVEVDVLLDGGERVERHELLLSAQREVRAGV